MLRPAIFIKKGTKEFLSISPTMCYIISDDGEVFVVLINGKSISVLGSIDECIEEHENAMNGFGTAKKRRKYLDKEYLK